MFNLCFFYKLTVLPLKDEDETAKKEEAVPAPTEPTSTPTEEPPKPPPQEEVKTPRGFKAGMRARLMKAKVTGQRPDLMNKSYTDALHLFMGKICFETLIDNLLFITYYCKKI